MNRKQGPAHGGLRDADGMYAAYKRLEAEFTRRSQTLQALQKEEAVYKEENRALKQKLETELSDESFLERAAGDSRVAERILKAHLTKTLGLKPETPLLKSGSGFAAAAAREKKPKTLEEAALLAEQILKK